MAKVDTVTVYYGTDPYIINAAELKDYLDKGFTEKTAKSTKKAAETSTTTSEAEKTNSEANSTDSGGNKAESTGNK